MGNQKERFELRIDPPLLAWLRTESKRSGQSIGELIREAVRGLIEAAK